MKLTQLFESVVKEPTNHWELIRYTHSGMTYEGFITEVSDDHIVARVMAEDINAKFQTVILYKQVFRGLNVEYWFNGQGCDNSAIGISGYWDSLADNIGA